jgi:peptidyl-prolyl cis-trans isomerase C
MIYALLGAAALQAAAATLPADAQATQPRDAKATAAGKSAADAATPPVSNSAAAPEISPDAVLIQDGPVKVDVRDLDAFMLRIPEKMRLPFRTSYDRVASAVDSLYVARVAAQRAREAGLDKDPDVQRRIQQIQEAFLADLYASKLQAEVDKIDLEQRAKEIYAADPQRFTSPAQVYVQKILVGLNGRTLEMARERADQAYREATQGKEDFLQLSAKYSDDPDKVRNGGDIGFYPPSHFPPAVAEAIGKLERKGEIGGPIETSDGFWIVRFVERKPEKLVPYAAVKQQIIDQERERLRKEKMDRFVAEIRGSKTVVTNTGNVEAYVVKVDPATGEPQAAGVGKREAAAAGSAAKR